MADPGVMSSPFTVRSSMAGYASAAPNDKARAEIWLPLWVRPAALAELKMFFSEGRSQVGRRPSRSGVDFARAIATLGVDRGISAFQRVGFIERSGQAYLATPLGRWPVLGRPEVNLIDDIDSWLDRFRGFSLASRTPASFRRCLRNIETAILGVCKDATATQWQRLIIALGDVGWGHSSVVHAIGLAEASGARRLALVHHDPMRTDPELDTLAQRYGGVRQGSGLDVCFAHEGLSVTL